LACCPRWPPAAALGLLPALTTCCWAAPAAGLPALAALAPRLARCHAAEPLPLPRLRAHAPAATRCWAALASALLGLRRAAGPRHCCAALGLRCAAATEPSLGLRSMFRFLYFLRIELLSYFSYESNFDK